MAETLLSIVLSSSAVLGGALWATRLMRRRSAAARHLVWTAAMALALLLPPVALVGPVWHVPVPARVATSPDALRPEGRPVAVFAAPLPVSADRSADSRSSPDANNAGQGGAFLALWPQALGVLWSAGIAFWLLGLAVGQARAGRMTRRARPLEDVTWQSALAEAARRTGVGGRVAMRISPQVASPVVTGLWQTTLLLPTAAESWPAERRRIVLLHELAHVQRRDLAVQTLARMVRALYWFNPLVHLALRRLRVEQERACDDTVLLHGADASAYARELIEIARLLRPGRTALEATLAMAQPSQLEGRLRSILDTAARRWAPTGARRAQLVAALVAAVLPLGTVRPTAVAARPAAQESQAGQVPVFVPERAPTYDNPQGIAIRAEPIPPDAPRFEAASIRRNQTGNYPQMTPPVLSRDNRISVKNVSIRQIIGAAYNHQHLANSLVIGAPAWVESERYDLEAVAAAHFGRALVRNVLPPEASAMLRSLLADRLQFRAHSEVREMEILELMLDREDGRLGPDLTVSELQCLGSFDLVDLSRTTGGLEESEDGSLPNFCPLMLRLGGDQSPTTLIMKNSLMRHIAMFIAGFPQFGRPIVDRTGLTGRYDMQLVFEGVSQFVVGTGWVPGTVRERAEYPTLRGALQEQLGLRVREARGPVEVLVIDHVERPSEN